MKNQEERKQSQKRNEALCAGDYGCGTRYELELLENNASIIEHMIGKYAHLANHLYDLDDMTQSATNGLFRAAKTYDPQKGSFATYARIWIKREILADMFNDRMLIYVPDSTLRLYYKLQHKYQYTLSDVEFYEMLDEDDELTEAAKNRIRRMSNAGATISIYAHGTKPDDATEGKGCLADTLAASDDPACEAEDNVYRMQIINLVFNSKKLKDTERWVIAARFGIGGFIPMTLEECAEAFPWGKRTKERIRQIEQRALQKLKEDKELRICAEELLAM